MVRGRHLLVTVATAVGLLVVALGDGRPAAACTCATPTAKVQHGLAYSSVVLAGAPSELIEESLAERRFRFEVDTYYKADGEAPRWVEITTGASGESCGVPFRIGTRYLVFAMEQGTSFAANSCGPTQKLAAGDAPPRALGGGVPVTAPTTTTSDTDTVATPATEPAQAASPSVDAGDEGVAAWPFVVGGVAVVVVGIGGYVVGSRRGAGRAAVRSRR